MSDLLLIETKMKKEEDMIEGIIKKKEDELDTLIDEKEEEIETLKDIAYDLRVKRIGDDKKVTKGVGTPFVPPSSVKTIDEMQSDVASAFESDPDGFNRYIKKLYENTTSKCDDTIPGIPTRDGVAFKEPVTGLQLYKGRLVNPDSYKVVDGKLYFKDPHENCGGDIIVTECMGGWNHGHAQCTKCGKDIGNWISGADNMPFYG